MDFFSLPPFFANFASSLPLAPRTFNFAFAAVLGSEARGGLKGSRYSAAPNSLSVLPAAFPRARARFFRSPLAFPSPRPFFPFFFLPSPLPPQSAFYALEDGDGRSCRPFLSFPFSLLLSRSLASSACRSPISVCFLCLRARTRATTYLAHNETHTWILSGPLGRGEDDRCL